VVVVTLIAMAPGVVCSAVEVRDGVATRNSSRCRDEKTTEDEERENTKADRIERPQGVPSSEVTEGVDSRLRP
jgi:hypothetical protein